MLHCLRNRTEAVELAGGCPWLVSFRIPREMPLLLMGAGSALSPLGPKDGSSTGPCSGACRCSPRSGAGVPGSAEGSCGSSPRCLRLRVAGHDFYQAHSPRCRWRFQSGSSFRNSRSTLLAASLLSSKFTLRESSFLCWRSSPPARGRRPVQPDAWGRRSGPPA